MCLAGNKPKDFIITSPETDPKSSARFRALHCTNENLLKTISWYKQNLV